MWTPVPDPDDKPDNSPKMKIILVVLFLFLIGELVYFFYIVPNKKITTTIVPTLMPTPEPTKAPTSVSPTTSPTKEELQGKIVGLEFNNKNKSEIIINLEETKDELTLAKKNYYATKFLIDEEGLKKMKVLGLVGEPLTYKDLKIGQNIKVNLIYDTNGAPYSSVIITIY